MIEFVGSQYQYQGEQLSSPEIIFIRDHHFNEELQEFPVKKLLENSICNPLYHTVIFDHVLQHEDSLTKYNLMFFPLFIATETQNFIDQKITTDWNHKSTIFNFMINKPRLHRSFLLLMIEHFKLNNFSYTLAWQHNDLGRKRMLENTTNTKYHNVIKNTQINIAGTSYVFGSEIVMEQGVRNGSFKNAVTYNKLLQKPVFEPSCVSLITEPAFFERETIITEKTIMAIYGGTIPIWVGGWRIADYMRDQGFDVFDDIVDHSYQDLTDPWDRCYYAIERNVNLLKDFDTVQKFVYNNKYRLQANLKLLESNTFINNIQQIVTQQPEKVKKELESKLKWLTHNHK